MKSQKKKTGKMYSLQNLIRSLTVRTVTVSVIATSILLCLFFYVSFEKTFTHAPKLQNKFPISLFLGATLLVVVVLVSLIIWAGSKAKSVMYRLTDHIDTLNQATNTMVNGSSDTDTENELPVEFRRLFEAIKNLNRQLLSYRYKQEQLQLIKNSEETSLNKVEIEKSAESNTIASEQNSSIEAPLSEPEKSSWLDSSQVQPQYSSKNTPIPEPEAIIESAPITETQTLEPEPDPVKFEPISPPKDEEKELLFAALNYLEAGLIVTDTFGFIRLCNPVAAAMCDLAIADMQGMAVQSIFSLYNADTMTPLTNPIYEIIKQNKGLVVNHNTILKTRSGKELPVEITISPIRNDEDMPTGTVLLLKDISFALTAEQERLRNEKLEAVSFLSSGLAHDFNNLLTAILGNISLALEEIPENSEPALLLKDAEASTNKGRDITNRLLAFAKGSKIMPDALPFTNQLENLVISLTQDSNVTVRFQFDGDLPPIAMSDSVFGQIITHLVNNALQAMKDKGELIIRAQICDHILDKNIPFTDKKYVCIHIIDNGEGIPLQNQNRIFIPYFTTRPRASGLGLPTVYSLLKKHDGYIRIHSQYGKGTDAEVFIPIAEPTIKTHNTNNTSLVSSCYKVLVFEEEEFLRSLLIKTLEKMGLIVETVKDVENLKSSFYQGIKTSMPFDLIILNINVNLGIDIWTLVEELKSADSKLKLIACSSFVYEEELTEYIDKGFDDVLPKPFHINQLKEVVTKNIKGIKTDQ